jgi:hypothetical protein
MRDWRASRLRIAGVIGRVLGLRLVGKREAERGERMYFESTLVACLTPPVVAYLTPPVVACLTPPVVVTLIAGPTLDSEPTASSPLNVPVEGILGLKLVEVDEGPELGQVEGKGTKPTADPGRDRPAHVYLGTVPCSEIFVFDWAGLEMGQPQNTDEDLVGQSTERYARVASGLQMKKLTLEFRDFSVDLFYIVHCGNSRGPK